MWDWEISRRGGGLRPMRRGPDEARPQGRLRRKWACAECEGQRGLLDLGGAVVNLQQKSTLLDVDDVLDLLRAEVASTGSQSEWARQKKVNRTIVSAILKRRRRFQPKVIRALGLKKIDAYTRS